MLVLSDGICLNPKPVYNSQPSCSNVFKAKGIHLIHLNVNSLLPKIDKIWYIAAHANVSVTGISESKLHETIFQPEIQISNYELLRCDRNRNSGGVTCLLEVISVTYKKHFFPREIENIFVEILLPKTKLLIVGIIYRPPNQSNFLEIINTN